MKNHLVTILCALVVAAAATVSGQEAAPGQAPAPAQAPATAPDAGVPQVEPGAPAARPMSDPEIVVPAGTTLPIVLNTFLNTRSSQVGDTFYADTTYPIWIQQRLAIPRGSIVRGTVTYVQRPGKVKGKGRISIRFEDVLLPNGVKHQLVGELHGLHGPGVEKIDRKTETIEMGGSQGKDTAEIIGPAGEGALIGAIGGGGQGAGIGAGAGAAVGLATVLFTRGQDLVLGPGTQFDVILRQPLRFSYTELEFTRDELSSAERSNFRRPAAPQQQQQGGRSRGRWGLPVPWYTSWP
jgi:hypothetical protein